MRVVVRYTEEVTTPFDETFFQRVAEETLKRSASQSPVLSEKEEVSLNVIAVSSEKIQELNKTYRGKDAVTDILSFGEYTDIKDFENDTEKTIFLGELFFCQDFIANAAKEDEVTGEHEMIYVFSHGVLHLLGHDHSPEMFALQDAVTEQLMAGK
jgi:probable rRNA maturation factor